MKNLVSIYFDSGMLKIAIFEKTSSSLQILKLISSYPLVNKNEMNYSEKTDLSKTSTEMDFDGFEFSEDKNSNVVDIEKLNTVLNELKFSKYDVVISSSTPEIDFVWSTKNGKSSEIVISKLTEEIAANTGQIIGKDLVDFLESENEKNLGVYIKSEIKALNLLNELASKNRKRSQKIVGIKNSEITLAKYVVNNNEILANEHSVVIYLDKFLSTITFLKGKSIVHFGEKLDIGTNSEVYSEIFSSKIFYEMEKSNISHLDNIFLCGENIDEDVRMKFYINFPETKIKIVDFNSIKFDEAVLSENSKTCSFAIPIATALEYSEEIDKKKKIGITILPTYIKEQQKSLSLGFTGIVIFILLFLSAFYFTSSILEKETLLKSQERQIRNLEKIKSENSDLINQISGLSGKVSNFSNTKLVLDSLTLSNREWSNKLMEISNFAGNYRNFWLKTLTSEGTNSVDLSGYSLSRGVLTDLARFNQSSTIFSMLYEPLKKLNTYKFNLKFPLKVKK